MLNNNYWIDQLLPTFFNEFMFLLYTKREVRLQAALRSLNHPTIIERISIRAIRSSMLAVIRSMITAIYFDFVRYYVKNNKLYIEVREHR